MSHQFLSEEEIQAAEQRCQQATPGEWEVQFDLNIIAPDPRGGNLSPLNTSSLSHEQRKANHEFCADAHQTLPRALSDVRELRRVVRELKSWLQFHLDKERIYIPTKDGHGNIVNGYGAVPFPDWAVRQKLEALDAALALARQVEGGK